MILICNQIFRKRPNQNCRCSGRVRGLSMSVSTVRALAIFMTEFKIGDQRCWHWPSGLLSTSTTRAVRVCKTVTLQCCWHVAMRTGCRYASVLFGPLRADRPEWSGNNVVFMWRSAVATLASSISGKQLGHTPVKRGASSYSGLSSEYDQYTSYHE